MSFLQRRGRFQSAAGRDRRRTTASGPPCRVRQAGRMATSAAFLVALPRSTGWPSLGVANQATAKARVTPAITATSPPRAAARPLGAARRSNQTRSARPAGRRRRFPTTPVANGARPRCGPAKESEARWSGGGRGASRDRCRPISRGRPPEGRLRRRRQRGGRRRRIPQSRQAPAAT